MDPGNHELVRWFQIAEDQVLSAACVCLEFFSFGSVHFLLI